MPLTSFLTTANSVLDSQATGRRVVYYRAMPDWKKLLDDASEQVGQGIKVAGKGLGSAADEARKVAGIGVGTIGMELGRSGYSLGDKITGVVRLKLTEPIQAARLVVVLEASRKRYVTQRGSDGRVSPVQRTETLINHEVEVAGERSYDSGSHRFTVHLPTKIDAKINVGGTLGDVLNAAQAVKSMTESPIKWKLRAILDIPWKRNLSKQIDLAVRE